MSETTPDLSNQEKLAARILDILESKKAKDIEKILVEGKTVLADYFIVATAGNQTQIKALADEIEFKLKEELGLMPHHIEGESGRRWILLDYGDVVVNLFLPEDRAFYKLEKLWAGRQAKPAGEEAKPLG